jgi:hypothetical protein
MPDCKPSFHHCESPAIASIQTGISRHNAARKEPEIYSDESGIATLSPPLWHRIRVPIARLMSSGCVGLAPRSLEDHETIPQPKETAYAVA